MFDLLFQLIDYLNKIIFKESRFLKKYLRQLAALVIASNDEFGFVVCIDAIFKKERRFLK